MEVVIAFNSEKNYLDLLNVILNKMMEITNADAGTLYVSENDMLHFRIMKTVSMGFFQGPYTAISLPPIALNENNIENISAYSAIKNEMVCIDDVYEDESFNFAGPKNYDKLTGYRTKSMLAFPLSTVQTDGSGNVIGVIQLINAIDKETGEVKSFRDVYDLSVLMALASVSANALANIIYAKEVDELFNSFVKVMAKAIDERSVYNVNHTNNVAKYCDEFARFLSEKFSESHEYYFTRHRRDQLVMAGMLHDIGKIITPLEVMDKKDRLGGQLEIIKYKFEIKSIQLENKFLKNEISAEQYEKEKDRLKEAIKLIEETNAAGFLPDEKIELIKKLKEITYTNGSGETVPILTEGNLDALTIRKGTLTEAEREIMQEHVSITGRLLDNMKFNKYYQDVPNWARCHHEFLDGTGYPLGLKGDEISPEVCILSIIDIFDALTAKDRPYKKAMPLEKAYSVIKSMAEEGKLHNELVQLFIESGVS